MRAGKSGLLRVLSSNSARKGPHTVNLSNFFTKHAPKWWIVRESYMVSVSDPAELQVDDVFLLDQDFSIERPKRYYRQGLSLLHLGEHDDEKKKMRQGGDWDATKRNEDEKGQRASKFWSLTKKKSKPKLLASNGSTAHEGASTIVDDAQPDVGSASGNDAHEQHHDDDDDTTAHGIDGNVPAIREPGVTGGAGEGDMPSHRTANPDGTVVADVPDDGHRYHNAESSSDDEGDHHPIIDPSIGQDPRKLADGMTDGKKKASSKDVSQHTFFVRNTQRKVKFVAKNEVSLTWDVF